MKRTKSKTLHEQCFASQVERFKPHLFFRLASVFEKK
jgi:hypothetical protein